MTPPPTTPAPLTPEEMAELQAKRDPECVLTQLRAQLGAQTMGANLAEQELARHIGKTALKAMLKQMVDTAGQRDALTADNTRLREALEAQPCKCRKRVDDTCPSCGGGLRPVINRGPLNEDQFDAVKAGDYYCTACKGDEAKTGFKYWRDRDMGVLVVTICGRCSALAATPAQSLARIQAEAIGKYIDDNSITCDCCQHVMIDVTAAKAGTVGHCTAGDPEGEGSGCAHGMHAERERNDRRVQAEWLIGYVAARKKYRPGSVCVYYDDLLLEADCLQAASGEEGQDD